MVNTKKKMLFTLEKKLFLEANKIIKSHPYLVVIAMHEYSRNLYDVDPHIPYKQKNHVTRLIKVMQNLIKFLSSSKELGSYFNDFNESDLVSDPKIKSGQVYGKFWKELTEEENLRTIKLIKNRFKSFKKIRFNSYFKNKNILDAGCGGGRFSYALSGLGPKKVTGIDFGVDGLKLARQKFKAKNLEFKQANVLDIPFKDNTFDFVLSNGVIHHTEDFEKGLHEVIRVCKPGGDIYLYLYGKGGLFWSSRHKMNKMMKMIPQDFTKKVLDNIGMPTNRWIFQDNWYVPIERHCTYEEVERICKKLKVSNIEVSKSGMPTDLHILKDKYSYSEDIWGNGEVRLLITK